MLTTINFPHVVEYVMHSGARHVPALRCLNCLDFLHLFTIRDKAKAINICALQCFGDVG